MTGASRWTGAAVLVLAMTLGGCGDSSDPGPAPGPDDATTAAPAPDPEEPEGLPEPGPEPSTAPESHVDIEDTPGSLEGFVGALADADVTSFEPRDGEWLAEGTVTNPTESTVLYRIYVSAMGEGGTTTRGVVQVDVPDVPAGGSASWSAGLPIDDDGLSVVLRVERAAAEG